MSKLRFLSIVAVLLLILNGGTLIYLFLRQNKEYRPLKQGNNAGEFIIKELKLNDQQQQQFAELKHEHRRTVREAEQEDKRLHDVYFSLLKTDNPDQHQVDSVSTLMAIQRGIIETATFAHFQQLRKICNDDQKKRFDVIIDEIARRVAPKGPPPHGPGGPPPPPHD